MDIGVVYFKPNGAPMGTSLNLTHHEHDHLRGESQIQAISLARDTLIVNYVCSALTWVVYDFIICYRTELSLVWGRWHFVNGRHARRIYVAVRYLSLVFLSVFAAVNLTSGLSSDELRRTSCNAWYYVVVIMTTAITLLSNSMILIRINASYHWDVKVLALTVLVFFVQLISGLAIGFLTVSTSETGVAQRRSAGCSISSPSVGEDISLAAWIPSIMAHCVYLILMFNNLLKGITVLDSGKDRTFRKALKEMHDIMPTTLVSMKHGLLYFSITIGTQIANAIVIATQHGPLQALCIPLMIAIYVIVGCRIYLDIISYMYEQPELEHMESITFS